MGALFSNKMNDPHAKDPEKVVDLREQKKLEGLKTKKEFFNEDILKEVYITNDVICRLVSNDKGIFVDMRKFYKGSPTQKGVRIAAGKFIDLYRAIKEDIKDLVPSKNSIPSVGV